MLEIWDYVTIVGIALQIVGFIILLAGFKNKINTFLRLADFILRIPQLKKGEAILDYDKFTKPVIDENKINRILGRWNVAGILLVIFGLFAQIIAILIEKF